MTYEPTINDYVKWKDNIEGWVYFKDIEYITIEVLVRPKHEDDLKASPIHSNNRLLVICCPDHWKELTYIKSRKSVYE